MAHTGEPEFDAFLDAHQQVKPAKASCADAEDDGDERVETLGMGRLSLTDKCLDMPRQLPDLDSWPLNFDLQGEKNPGRDTPKFKDDGEVGSDEYYLRKR